MMNALILILCTTTCNPVVISDQFTSLHQCLAASQPAVVEYMKDRRGRVEKFMCTDARRIPFYLGRNTA